MRAKPRVDKTWWTAESLGGRPLRDMLGLRDMAGEERGWLRQRAAELRLAFGEPDYPLGRGFIHADMHNRNLLPDVSRAGGVVLGDWDSVATGLREVDLVPTYQEPRLGDPSRRLTRSRTPTDTTCAPGLNTELCTTSES